MSITKPKAQLGVPTPHMGMIQNYSFSPDGKLLLTSADESAMKLWNQDGRLIKDFKATEGVTGVRLINNEKFLISTDSGKVSEWDIISNSQQLVFKGEGYSGEAISADGNKIIFRAGKQEGWGNEIYRQISLYDVRTQKYTVFPEVHTSNIEHFLISDNGDKSITAQNKELVVWNTNEEDPSGNQLGAVLHQKNFSTNVSTLSVAKDGQLLAIGFEDGKVGLLELSSGKFNELVDHNASILHVQIAENGLELISFCEEQYTFWDTQSLNKKGAAVQWKNEGWKVMLNGDLSNLYAWTNAPRPVDWETGEVQQAGKETVQIQQSVISCKHNFLALYSKDGFLRYWDFNTNKSTLRYPLSSFNISKGYKIRKFDLSHGPGEFIIGDNEKFWVMDKNTWSTKQSILEDVAKKYGIHKVDISADGKKFAIAIGDNAENPGHSTLIYNRNPLKLEKSIPSKVINEYSDDLALSYLGNQLLVIGRKEDADNGWTVKLWDINQVKLIRELDCGQEDFNAPRSFSWSKNDQKFAAGLENGRIFVWDIANNFERKEFHSKENIKVKSNGESYDRVSKIEFSPDGSKLAAAYFDSRQFVLFDVESGNEDMVIIDHLNADPDVFNPMMFFSEDGRILFTSAQDNFVALWDTQKLERIATIYFIGDREWAITTASGLFDASEGAMDILYYTSGLEVIGLSQMKDRYYEPGLLKKIIDFGPENLREVGDLGDVDLYPEVEVKRNGDNVTIELIERDGGLGKVQVYINQKLVWEDKNEAGKKLFRFDLKGYQQYFSIAEEDEIVIRTYNKGGWLISPEYHVPDNFGTTAKSGGRKARKKKKRTRSKQINHKLYGIFVGTSKFRSPSMNLKYPETDAAKIASAIESVGSNLFGTSNQELHLLTTAETDPAKQPSKKNIKAAFDNVASSAKADDVCFLFFSGHGENWGQGEHSQFYYLTKDMASPSLKDEDIRKNLNISSAELADWINKIPCKLQVLVLDACYSGNVLDSLLAGQKAVDSAKLKALDRLKDRTGMFVLSGSPGDKVSWETSHFGQGLLTYSLLFGMTGAAHVTEGGNKFVDVMKLLQYSRDEVPKLAREISKVQEPMLAMPKGGDSFDIGIFKQDNFKVKLSQRKPIICQSIVLNRSSFYDDLGLTAMLDSRLIQESNYGKNGKITFVNIPSFNNAYTVRGLYALSEDRLEVRIKVYKEGKNIDSFNLVKTKEEIAVLVEEITNRLFRLPTSDQENPA